MGDSEIKQKLNLQNPALLQDLRQLVRATRERVARTVNSESDEESERMCSPQNGEEIVSTLSGQLRAEFGNGFSRQNLFHMLRFAEGWPEESHVRDLASDLGWSHIKEILYMENPQQRKFYAELCAREGWSVRTLRSRIQGLLYERTAISRKPEALIDQELEQLRTEDRMTPDLVFRDPYLLDFLGLADTYSE